MPQELWELATQPDTIAVVGIEEKTAILSLAQNELRVDFLGVQDTLLPQRSWERRNTLRLLLTARKQALSLSIAKGLHTSSCSQMEVVTTKSL